MLEQYCHHQHIHVDEWITEIGGGMNFRRKHFLRLVDQILAGEVEQVVLAHQDRLARFAYSLLVHLCQTHQCKLVVMNTEKGSPEQELVQDLITITHCFPVGYLAYGTTARRSRRLSRMIKAHKIRLNPTPEQATYFAKAAGTARFCFNWARAQWQEQYEAGGTLSALALR